MIDYKIMFSPMKIGNCEIKNRIVMPPIHVGMANINGTPSEKFMNYYEERAKGGTGLIITEITRVNDGHGATTFRQPAMSHDYHIEPMRRFVDRIHKHGTKLFVQLHHPGRQNLGIMVNTVPLSISCSKIAKSFEKTLFKVAPVVGKKMDEKHLTFRSVAPSKCERSAVANSNVRALSKKEIGKLVQQFIDAAVRCKKAGVDGIELHSAHGYLLQQFLSPNTNHRNDAYGGNFENRLRFIREIIEGIRRECGKDYPLIVRLTVDECYDRIGQPGKGFGLDMGLKYAKAIEAMGVDALDITSAAYDTYNYWLEPTSFDCGWRAYMAEAVKKEVSVPVIAANLIRSPEQAEKQLNDGIQDFVALGRPQIADPHWANKVASGKKDEIKRCICCLHCMESMLAGAFLGENAHCSLNPAMGREKEFVNLPKDGSERTIVIVGAGVAGLMAAEILGRRGFRPIVLERSNQIGGQIQLAIKPPKKEKLSWCIEDLSVNAKKYGAEIKTNIIVDEKVISSYNPYGVIIATGASAIRPRSIEGVNGDNVFTTVDILSGSTVLTGKKIAIVGSGLTGIETAELLLKQENEITIIEMADEIAPTAWFQHKIDILPKLENGGVNFITSSKLCSINRNNILLENQKNGKKSILDCDAVVLSMGSRSEDQLYDKIKHKFNNVYLIGDAKKVGNIASATSEAYRVATQEIR
ncbi:NADH oxidase [Eubacterium callanderi]|uniref:oxidoreductase n=1 Tax=Eubacterium callanderi TaxID=53442 RepID=UPI0029FECE41|nr:FAD-dependent oxidoreductase [Eubacterium callanderi]WPK69209.1 NADH oxidase [Eubacterium callanderi]WPK73507.1 NADH oxidase [Eubacterium callanderi]